MNKMINLAASEQDTERGEDHNGDEDHSLYSENLPDGIMRNHIYSSWAGGFTVLTGIHTDTG